MISAPELACPNSRPKKGNQKGRWLATLTVLAGLVGVGFACDPVFKRWFAHRTDFPWEPFAQFVSHVGDWPALATLALCGLLLARTLRKVRWMTLFCMMLAATLLAGATVHPIRALTGRSRPHPEKVGGWYGPRKEGKWIVGRHRYSAFPSAHTAVAAAFFTPLVVLGGARWLPLWLVAVAVGWSRIYLGSHHPSDVMVGLILGSGCGWLVACSPGIRWWIWRFCSVLCGIRRLWPGRERSAALLLGRSSA